MYLFSFVSRYFSISLVISSLTHLLFKNVLFNFYIFVIFLVFLLFLISSLITLWSEKIVCIILIFRICWHLFCDLTCGLSQRMFHVHSRRIYILLSLGGVFCICLLDPIRLQCCSNLLIPYWSSVWLFYPLFKVGYLRLQLLMYSCLFLSSILSMFASYIFRSSDVWCIHVYNCYIFLVNWFFYHYMMSFFLSYNCFWLKVHLADISVTTSALFWLLFAWNNFFHLSLSTYVCP